MLLGASPYLQFIVNIKIIISQLMECLLKYAPLRPQVMPKFLREEAPLIDTMYQKCFVDNGFFLHCNKIESFHVDVPF
jgi:hypothetical protein